MYSKILHQRRGTKKGKCEEDIYHMFNNITGKYHCLRCDKTYSGKSGLYQHYQNHLGNYNYWCSECARGFAVKSHYEDHTAKHEGRTFPCYLCEKRFKAKSSLQTHYKEQHGQNVSRTILSVWN